MGGGVGGRSSESSASGMQMWSQRGKSVERLRVRERQMRLRKKRVYNS